MSGRATRSRRHSAILRLLRARTIASQGDLAEALADEGHHVTQSTLSRDLRDLRVVRVASDEGFRYRPLDPPPQNDEAAAMRAVAASEVLQVAANETVVVIRTRVGRASGVAAFLDGRRPAGVLATLAGDDTILVVPVTVERVADLERELGELLSRERAAALFGP